MEFTTVKELYHNTDAYIGKEITVGGWVRSNRDCMTVRFLRPFRSYTRISWKTLQRSARSTSGQL